MFELSVFLKDRLVGRTTFENDEVRIGRSADNEVQIDNLALSRYHASIERVDDLYVLKDFGTPNGTFLNGERVQGRSSLDDGDRIGLGKFTLVFRNDKKAEPVEAAKIRDEAAYVVAGKTMTGMVVEASARERTCPFVGFLELDRLDPAEKPVVSTLHRDVTVVGSDPSCDVVVAEQRCPPRAAAIVRGWQGFVLVALCPQVTLNGAPVEVKANLANGWLVTFGGVPYRFRLGRPESGS